MKGAKASLVGVAITAMLLITSCSAVETPPAQASNAEQTLPAPDPQYKPEVETIQPINNTDEQIVSTCNRNPGEGVIMTFDDYGTPEEVDSILTTLRELNWRAAFFPTGEWSLENWGLIQKIQQEGHIVGNHTMTHPDLVELLAANKSEFYSEIYPLRDFATTNPMLLRPPYGSGLQDAEVAEILTNNNAQLCGWTADSNDWRGGTASEMLTRVMDGYEYSPVPLAPDGVVLAHIHGEHTIEFITLLSNELDSKNWYREPLKK